jgi:hypothetical protein
LTIVNFPQILIVTGVLAATASVVTDEIAAQSLAIEDTIAVQSTWRSGYMALGGGLAKAMPKQADKKPVAAAPERRVVRRSAPQTTMPRDDQKTPIVFIAETLDHTGENIATLGVRTAPR